MCLVILCSYITAEWRTATNAAVFPRYAFLWWFQDLALTQWLLTNTSVAQAKRGCHQSVCKPNQWQCGHLVVIQVVVKLHEKWPNVRGGPPTCLFRMQSVKFTIFYHSKVSPLRCGPHNVERGSPWERRGRALETKETLKNERHLITITIQNVCTNSLYRFNIRILQKVKLSYLWYTLASCL